MTIFGAVISGVYYVRMPQHSGGNCNTRSKEQLHEDIILYPKEGEFIMFPLGYATTYYRQMDHLMTRESVSHGIPMEAGSRQIITRY